MLDFSIIIPFFNEEKYITRCAQSLLHQSFSKDRYEIIFVDNRSTDSSRHILKQFEPSIKVLSEEKLGSYAARNTGIKQAKGRFIAFTDGDCEVDANWLTHAFQALEFDQFDLVQGTNHFNTENKLLTLISQYENQKLKFIMDNKMEAYLFAHTNNLAVKKKVFYEHGFFGEAPRGMDTEFIQRLGNRIRFSYSSTMEINHLEIQHWYDWHRKMLKYAKSAARLEGKTNYRVLKNKDRLKILQLCLSEDNSSVFERIMCLALIFTTGVSFELTRRFFQPREK